MLDQTDTAELRMIQAHRLNGAGLAAWKSGRLDAAATLLRRAMALAPNWYYPIGNFGLVQWHRGFTISAGSLMRRAASMAPDDADMQNNLGIFHGAMRDYRQADECMSRSRTLRPGDPGPIWDHAIGLLDRGAWELAWPDYEIRITREPDPRQYPIFPVPTWNGESLEGKTIYVQAEQGIGDRIHFARYLDAVKFRWPTCRIVFCVGDDLINLFWDYRGTCELLPSGIPFPEKVDYAAFLMSIPRHFGARPDNIVLDPGFILSRVTAQRKAFPARLPEPHLPSLKVGLVWTGNPDHARNRDRSVPLERLVKLGANPAVTLYGFQVGPGAADVEALGLSDLINPVGHLLAREGWLGTALALLELDLLVTVDTAVAHLAGALDVPTLMLAHYHADWRWGQAGAGVPWYPSIRLMRQEQYGDWSIPVDHAREYLAREAVTRFGTAVRE